MPPSRPTVAGQEAATASGGGGGGAAGGAGAKPTLEEALYAGLGRVVEIFRRFDLTLTDEVDKVDFRRTLAAVLVGDFDRKEIDQLFERFEVDRCGKINYKDFNRLIRKEHHVSLKARRHASDARIAPDRRIARPWRKAAEEFALSEGNLNLARQGLPPLHLGRKRELVQLLRHFSQQHEDGVCGVATFKDLIKLEYPKAFPDELRAMLDFVRMLTAYEEAAATEAKAKQQQVEQLFRAIDADASGCIDEVRDELTPADATTCYYYYYYYLRLTNRHLLVYSP